MRSFLVLFFVLLSIVGVALSDTPTKDGYEVTQIHIAQGKSSSEMSIAWVTANVAQTECKYGTDADNLVSHVTGEVTSYSFDSRIHKPYQSGQLHSAVLTGLNPKSTYYYQCGDFSTGALSGIISFQTLPSPGDDTSITFGIVGDLGNSDDSKKTVGHMSMNPNLGMVLHVGDISYANCDQPKWDSYALMVEDLASQTPWMVGAGNHEVELEGAKGTTFFTAFEKRFRMPAEKPAEFGSVVYNNVDFNMCIPMEFQAEYNYGNSFYSFDAGLVHVINLNTFATTNSSSVQYNWLLKDLKSVNREVTPWIVVMMHCPWYSSNKQHHDERQTVEMKDTMESLFYEHHVNVVFAGHVHAYERTYPIFQNETKTDGIVYIDIGDGGNGEGHNADYYEWPSWTAYRNGTQYGHGELAVVNKTHMNWKWNRNADGVKISMDHVVMCNSIYGAVDCSV